MRKIILVLIAIGIAVAGWYAWDQYRQQQAAETISNLQTVTAGRGRLTATIGATGTVRSNQTTVLTWQTTGTVEQVNVEVDDLVVADQVLATIQKTSLPQNVITAEVELNNAQKAREDLYDSAETAKTQALQSIATYAQAVKDAQYQLDNYTVPSHLQDLDIMEAVDRMQERLDQAREAFEPYKYLSSNNSTRQDLKEALDEAQSDYNAAVKRLEYVYQLEVAQSNLAKAREDYEKWEEGPDPADIANIDTRIDAAQATLDLAQLTAPFAATVTEVNNKPGDQVSPGTAAFRLDDLSHLLVDVMVSEVDINRVEPGQDAYLSFDAILGKEYQGKVVEVAQVGTDVQGIVEFKVTVELTSPDEAVKPGMTAAVNIVVNELENVLLVPNRAVRIEDGERVVFILQNNQPESVTIVLGASSDTNSEVIDGELNEGDLIILNPPAVFDSDGPPPFVRQ
jgi:HlyD family secretion protein